ncbi:MAG TPA: anthranilate synthase component I, partial [Vicinamibacteria bacterium]|nr:anthranilate synthase component I [Vicinamibacteria bacterium]
MRALGYDEYERLSAKGGLVPVFREVPGDLRTPVSAFLSLAARSERAFLLESVVGGERVHRYSFLGRDPVSTVEARASGLRLRDAKGDRDETKSSLLDVLRAELGARAAEVPGLPRFTGGAVGYLNYDAVRLFERIPDRHRNGDA